MKKTNLLNLEKVDYYMEEAAALGFRWMRCDEFAEWIIELYYGTPAEDMASCIAHVFWEQGDKPLESWKVYAFWHHLEIMSEVGLS